MPPHSAKELRASRTLEQLLEGYHQRISIEESVFVVHEGPHAGLEVPLKQELFYIGRADWCDLALPEDKHTSSLHCEIRVEKEGIRLLDRGSRNGCFLAGQRVFDAILTPETPLKLGNTVCSLHTQAGRRADIDVRYSDASGQLVGQDPQMRKIFSLVSRLGPRDIPVLLTGETGTGKSSIARALHAQSTRSGSLVTVNCGALSPSLVESELFGYEKGAFTGADKQHKGYFEQAHGGTLFLDEIGELPLELQPKLLDVLERKKVRRLGASVETDVDFRLLSATHRALPQDIEAGLFRQDLYYRLAVMELYVPSLRDRKEDLPLLVHHLQPQLSRPQPFRVSAEALRRLQGYYWPGNLRELRNVLERSALLLEGDVLGPEDLLMPPGSTSFQTAPSTTAPATDPVARSSPMKLQLANAERQILAAALEHFEWNVSKCAQSLEVSRSWLHGRIKSHGLQRPET